MITQQKKFVASVLALVAPGQFDFVEHHECDSAAEAYRKARSRARFFAGIHMSMFDVCRSRPDMPNLPRRRGRPVELVAGGYVPARKDRHNDR